MNRFLSNINKIPITMKHLSVKYDLNTISDHQSRHPSECESETCLIQKFIKDLSETVIDPAAKCAPIQPNSGGSCMSVPQVPVHKTFFNRAAWLQAQNNNDSCRAAKSHLISRKIPTSKAGDLNNKIRFLIRHAKLAPDGLLVTKGDSSIFTPGEPREKIIVPHNVAPRTLYHMHNSTHFVNHLSKNQLRTALN